MMPLAQCIEIDLHDHHAMLLKKKKLGKLWIFLQCKFDYFLLKIGEKSENFVKFAILQWGKKRLRHYGFNYVIKSLCFHAK